MKIVLIGNLGKSFNETCDEIHMTNILRSQEHTVYDYNGYDIEHILSGKGWVNDYGRTFEPLPEDVDLLIVFKGGVTSGKTLRLLKSKCDAKKTIYWCPDLMENCGGERNPCYQVTQHLDTARECDLYLSKELGWKLEYQKAGVNFAYFPTNLAPSYIYNRELVRNNDLHFLHLCEIREEVYPVVFTGTFTDIGENRPIFLKKLDDKIDDLHIFSYNSECWKERKFKNVHGGVWDDNYKYLIGRTKINLALDWRTDVEGYWSDRINQIMACGGFVLAKYTRGMEREFGPDGKAIAYWSDLNDLVEKIKYYQEHEEYRSQIAEDAYRLAQGYHVAEVRVMEMLTLVNYSKYKDL